jgi:hypothetical protein
VKQKEGEILTSEVITSRLLKVHLPLMTVAIHLIRILEEENKNKEGDFS